MKKQTSHKILKANYKIFPYLVFLAYFFLFIEAYTYSGFLSKSFLIDTKVFAVVTIISSIGVVLYSREERKADRQFPENLVFYLNSLLLPVFIIFYFIMQISERRHFVNYVYSTFHLQPDQFVLIVYFSLGIMLVGVFRNLLGFVSKLIKINFIKDNILLIIIIIFLAYAFFLNARFVFGGILRNNLYILTNLGATHNQKMSKTWGFYYDYMKFVANHATPGSVIIVPPQDGPWLSTGNAGLDRYFLYPSWVLNGGFDSLDGVGEEYQYVLIAHGEWLVRDVSRYDWPKVPINAKKIWYYDSLTKEVSVTESKIYDPKDKINTGAWGLIEIEDD